MSSPELDMIMLGVSPEAAKMAMQIFRESRHVPQVVLARRFHCSQANISKRLKYARRYFPHIPNYPAHRPKGARRFKPDSAALANI
jgi:hypothetical protein